ncbi:hypothetical protein EP227_03745 [bacterium]|nr:MAG: hypothetical protein EP227_03745 [bacterium]
MKRTQEIEKFLKGNMDKTSNEMITLHDKDFNIIYANEAAKKILNLPLLDVTNAKCYEYYHGKEHPPEICPSCRCLLTGEPVSFERYEPHLNMLLKIKAIPLFDDSNSQLIGLIHIVKPQNIRRKGAKKRKKLTDSERESKNIKS